MDNVKICNIVTSCPKDTEQLAEKLSRNLKGGEVIELVGDLGGGKTTFVKGLARGLGSRDHVSSPTFKINNVYKGQHLLLSHFDLYRLGEAGIINNELLEIIGNAAAVCVIEWADAAHDVLPTDRLIIDFIPVDENERRLSFHYPIKLRYALKGIDS